VFPAERKMGLWHGVVAGFDGTSRARTAARWAAAEAAQQGCPLYLVRVVEHPSLALGAGWVPALIGPDLVRRRHLEDELVAEIEACRKLVPGLAVHGAVHDGAPCFRLAEHTDMVGADIVVVGSSGTGQMSRLLFGSTGSDLLNATRRTVVVVREPTPVQEACVATGYAPVVVAVDDVATAGRVLGFAFGMADRWGAPVLVVHADLRSDEAPGTHRDVPFAVVRQHLAGLGRRHPEVSVCTETVVDNPARRVLEHTTEARLVVVGDRRLGAMARALTGAISRPVLHRASCPVAVVS
jgi:nucleotide-binding universal stress UspA family protein